MNAKRLAAVLAVATWLSGCSTISEWFASDTAEPPAPLPPLSTEKEVLRPLWTASGGVGTDKQFLRLRPIVMEGRVVVSNADGAVAAYDTSGGGLLWRTETNVALSGGTGGGDDLVVVGGAKGEIVALNLKDGKERWHTSLSSEVLAPPAASDGIVVVRTIDGRVVGLSATDGSRLWVFSRTVPILSLRGTGAPLIVGGRVFVGLDSGHLVALGLHDGHGVWEAVVAVPKGRSELERMVDIDADPVLFEDTLYVAAFQGRVVAVNAESGQLYWSREISSVAGIGVDRDRVYVTDEDSVVWGLDRSSGSALWRQEVLRNRALTAPTPYGSAVLVGDLEGYLHALNRDDGRILGRFSLEGKPVLAAPLIQGAVLYAIGSGGTIAALRD
ncbi:Outer membrane protein assembly factor BamB [Gammaproteobacteria bacterium]